MTSLTSCSMLIVIINAVGDAVERGMFPVKGDDGIAGAKYHKQSQ